MNVLVLNAGSSSVKAAAFRWPDGGAPPDDAPGAREAAWSAHVRWTALPAHTELAVSTPVASRTGVQIASAGDAASELLQALPADFTPDLIAHRIVHGGSLAGPAVLDAAVRRAIEDAAELAPLHNAAALAGIDAASARYAGVAQAVDLDTAFHRTISPAAALYAGPSAWLERGWRKMGFHGISHRYCAARTAALLQAEPGELRMVSAHLGSGASLAAVRGGRSVDTTMGFTPLDGLIMGTRSGSVDPGLLLYLLRSGRYDAAELERVLNDESGLLGISDVSDDVREVLAHARAGEPRPGLAIAAYIDRIVSGIAAMAAACDGIDAIAFTGGVGEGSAEIRAAVCARLNWLGVGLPQDRDPESGDREIGPRNAAVRTVVIAAREELAIARATAPLVGRAAIST